MRTDRPNLTPSRHTKARLLSRRARAVRTALLASLLWSSLPGDTRGQSAPPAQEPEWRRVTTKDEQLSVMMPAPPRVYLKDGESYAGGYPITVQRAEVFMAYHDEAVFLVHHYKLSEPKKLAKSMLGVMKSGGGRPVFEPVMLGGLAGTRVVQHYANSYHVRYLFPGKNVLYELSADARDKNHPGLQRFFSSVRLGGENGAGLTAPAGAVAASRGDATPAAVSLPPARAAIQKAIIVFKPEPQFTTMALANNTRGLVKLRMLLSSSGRVSDISVVQGLPDGLTEQAVRAAEAIAFLPAVKDGRIVSQWIVVEYNFNS